EGRRVSPPPGVSPSHDGASLDASGELLRATWGWEKQDSTGFVGDQRRQDPAKGFVPMSLEAHGLSLGWQEVFELVLRSGERVLSRNCSLASRTSLQGVEGLRKVTLVNGEMVTLSCPKGLEVQWSAALLRLGTGAEVIRTRLLYYSSQPPQPEAADAAQEVAGITLWDLEASRVACGLVPGETGEAAGAVQQRSADNCFRAGGEVDGSPLINIGRGLWLAMEHPRAAHGLRNNGTSLVARLWGTAPSTAYFASLGAAAPLSQGSFAEAMPLLRRQFQTYLRLIRASAPRQHLHYASWYDLRRHPCVDSSALGLPRCTAAKTFNEEQSMQRLAEVHSQLAARGVSLDGMLLDDGWDDAGMPWQADALNFPRGLAPLSAAAVEKGTTLGVWLSPWGGFGEGGKRRVRLGASRGFEAYEGDWHTLRLSGPRCYAWFRNASRQLLLGSGVRFFKFDGVGAGLGKPGAGDFGEDVDKLLQLTAELREDALAADNLASSSGRRPSSELFVSAATGSWPSPFWLTSVDSVWRGGPDLGRKGVGSERQQWITFRDAMVYESVVQRAPLFPLSGLSLGGIVWSGAEEPGVYLNSYGLEDFVDEVMSFFMSGASQQELQVQPELLAPAHWDALASAVNVSRQNRELLLDSHWIGGDPAKGDAYGYASYACPPCAGLLSWRNPLAETRSVEFTLRSALALPQSWPGGAVGGRWRMQPIWAVPSSIEESLLPAVRGLDSPTAEAEAVTSMPAPPDRALPLPEAVKADAGASTHAQSSWEAVLLDQPLVLQLKGLELRAFKVESLSP
ncbi:unnamed protein product, partial [Polarella glacialis]